MAPLHVQVHVASALAALVVGACQLAGPKGVMVHRVLGWAFVAAMALVVVTAVFIRDANDGALSWVHVFVPVTTVSVISGVLHVRRGRIAGHRGAMRGLYIGALIVPGAIAFVPGRLMHLVMFG